MRTRRLARLISSPQQLKVTVVGGAAERVERNKTAALIAISECGFLIFSGPPAGAPLDGKLATAHAPLLFIGNKQFISEAGKK